VQTIAVSPKGYTSKPQCKRAIATKKEVGQENARLPERDANDPTRGAGNGKSASA
jgi:hypothetical protein